jgi:FHA domain
MPLRPLPNCAYDGQVRNRRSVETPTRASARPPTTGSHAGAEGDVGEPQPRRFVIDHVDGARRGQRQELAADARIRFGRHPECEVSFDAHRDIDASSRHAELRPVGDSWVLVDLGSSNGTFVEGHRSTEAPVVAGVPTMVEFGPGGPRLRLFVGDDAAIAALPPPPRPRRVPLYRRVVVLVGAFTAALLVALVVFRAAC